MSYIKQTWNGYDDALTVEQNAANGAVATPEAMNHMEAGIYEANKPFTGGTVTVAEEGAPLSVEVTEDKVINIVVPAGTPGEKGQDGIDGLDGQNGKSAFELAVEGGYTGTKEEWLASLKAEKGESGQDGQNGADGKSAYEIAVEGGYTGTQEEWLASLKGEKGDQGEPGQNGADGAPGEKGEPGEPGRDGVDGKDAVTETDVVEITTDMWVAVSEDAGAKVKAEIVDETIGASSVVIIAVEPTDHLVAVNAGMSSLVAVETGKFYVIADTTPTAGVGVTYTVLNPVEATVSPEPPTGGGEEVA